MLFRRQATQGMPNPELEGQDSEGMTFQQGEIRDSFQVITLEAGRELGGVDATGFFGLRTSYEMVTAESEGNRLRERMHQMMSVVV